MSEVDENVPPEVPVPPDGLGVRGSAFWVELHEELALDELEFSPKEKALVLEACRTLDLIDELAEALERDGLMSSGSTGQPVVHPAVAELRQQQASFARIAGALNMPADEAASEKFRYQRAKAGATARWQGGKLRAVN